MFDGIAPSVQLHYLAPHELPVWADRLRSQFQRIADSSKGRMLVEDVFDLVGSGKSQAWIVLRADDVICVIMTEVIDYPRLREMRFVALVGREPKAWAHVREGIEHCAKVHFGCSRISGVHHKRFRTLLPGYDVTHWISEKAL